MFWRIGKLFRILVLNSLAALARRPGGSGGSLRSQSVSQEEVCQWDHVLYVVGQIYAFGLVHG